MHAFDQIFCSLVYQIEMGIHVLYDVYSVMFSGTICNSPKLKTT